LAVVVNMMCSHIMSLSVAPDGLPAPWSMLLLLLHVLPARQPCTEGRPHPNHQRVGAIPAWLSIARFGFIDNPRFPYVVNRAL
jgi:hypothetical protein